MIAKAVTLATIALVAVTPGAVAETIEVRDNKPDAIQKAVNRADPGDKLRIHRGRYTENVVIGKRLKLVGVEGRRRPVIDGGCDTIITVNLQHRGILLRHLKVVGAHDEYNVNVIGQATARLNDLVVKETCDGANAAEYGINVFQSGAIDIRNNRAFGGFTDAGIYVGGITNDAFGPLIIGGNESYGNNRGIIVEDSVGVVRVRNNIVRGNTFGGLGPPTGIFSHNSDGIRYLDNRLRNNGQFGIHLDANSDFNVLNRNRVSGSDVANFRDQGSGNCGAGNSFAIDPC